MMDRKIYGVLHERGNYSVKINLFLNDSSIIILTLIQIYFKRVFFQLSQLQKSFADFSFEFPHSS